MTDTNGQEKGKLPSLTSTAILTRFPDQLLEGLEEVLRFDGLGKVSVHADLQRSLHVLVKGVGRQGDACAASRPSISGMRTSMRIAS